MKIYTKTGDKGTTSLVYGDRVSKSDVRVDAYGTCDEANSFIGLAVSHLKKSHEFEGKEEVYKVFHKVQTDLFHVGAELATPAGKVVKWTLTEANIEFLENTIDEWDAALPGLTNFILPGGNEVGATLHVARTVVRRAERLAVDIPDVNPLVIAYLNRLSDFLFVAGRFVNQQLGEVESILHS
ncbi:cob(I)yrinic acid a,c-diamide adenosyltransferase [Bacillus sp. PS06]|uniref:cob(I)yrinic acid a,c-diamide adenosyltransferase n=1 Tax=Bacillus sp. PS06 TaxID=2764176 RepID=UPI00177D1D3A|nr:cob(I)yrinic acid a,c-diamide adenosyltransferase [Bacillus sp. PS06]MBD8071186.1 cob(I)yrinic acid a,c-diamide adenosyltransferase [Bacillus sp. PS06]